MLRHIFIIAIAFTFFASAACDVHAQIEAGITGNPTIRVFNDSDGNLLIEGSFQELKGSTVTIVDGQGSKFEFKIGEFSVPDREWIRKQSAMAKKEEKLEKEYIKIAGQINGGKTSTIISGCNRLKYYGEVAVNMAPTLKQLWGHEETQIRRASFVAYIYISRKSDSDYASILNVINNNQHGLFDVMSKRPRDLMQAMAEFDSHGITYLKHVAFSGDIKADPQDSYSDEEPSEFLLAKGPKNSNRAAAIRALGSIKREASLLALIDVLPAAAREVNGKKDEVSVKAAIKAIGQIGIQNSLVTETLKEYEKDYPELVADALKGKKQKDD